MKYRIQFHGRKKGAIGLGSTYIAYREAPDEEAAQLALYDEYEHISGAIVSLVPQEELKA